MPGMGFGHERPGEEARGSGEDGRHPDRRIQAGSSGAGRSPNPVARYPVASAVTATPRYLAVSLMPSAKPRRLGPIRSIFMLTVIDQVSPWFTPSRTFAAITHAQLGPQAGSA